MVLKRMLLIAVIIIIINTIMISPIYAMGDVISAGKEFLQKGNSVDDVINTTALQSTSNFIYNMFLTIAIVLAVGVGTVLGIKFITSSVEGQAKIKEAVVPYIVGCIVIFAAFPIWSFIVDSGQDATGISDEGGTTEKLESVSYSIKYYCSTCGDELGRRELNAGKCSCGEKETVKKYYCASCGGELSQREQRNGKCSCGMYIKDL